ncbi:MAG: prepilin-type N-terminal cleavage/methylation domain-containing protein [Deltaproteobacteria bacterium]
MAEAHKRKSLEIDRRKIRGESVIKPNHHLRGSISGRMEKDRFEMTTEALKSKEKNDRRQRGFSLIEVLIGIILLSIGLLAMAGLQISSVLGNFNSKNLTQATYAIQDRLEVLESVPFDSLQSGEHNDGPVTMSGIDFNRAYTVVMNGDLKTIQYSVTWSDGTPHRISFSTVRSQ